jgi:hypothetical protein
MSADGSETRCFKIIDYLNETYGDCDIDNLGYTVFSDKFLKKLKIKVVFNKVFTAKNGKKALNVLFSKFRKTTITLSDDPIKFECNGFVAEYCDGKWSPMSIPPYNFLTDFDKKRVSRDLSENNYVIKKIRDGTSINLFYSPSLDRWVISTKNERCSLQRFYL